MQARIQKFFKGGLRKKILKEKCLLIHVSKRVHIKTRQTYNILSFLPFQDDFLLFFALFYYSFLFLKFERGEGCSTPVTRPSSRSANACLLYTSDAADDMQCVDLGGRRINKKTRPQSDTKT